MNNEIKIEKGVGVGEVRGDFHLTQNFPAPVTVTAQFGIPAPVGDFVGRVPELEQLCATLRKGGRVSISAVSGMGGVGKTQLALEAARRVGADFPDAQLYINLRGTDDTPPGPAAALAALVRPLVGETARLPEDAATLRAIYLGQLKDKRALVLLDNAADAAQVRDLLPPDGCAVMVTSRKRLSLAGAVPLGLDELEPSEARALLQGLAPRVADGIADRICYLCGYLPLAVRAAGSYLQVYEDEDAPVYAKQLEDERKRLELNDEETETSVEASFNLSYERLDDAARGVFHRLSVFPADFDGAAAEAVCADEGHRQLTGLVRLSLANYNTGTRRYRLHDLLRAYAKQRGNAAEHKAAAAQHAAHYATVLRQADELFLQGHDNMLAGLKLYDLESANIAAGQSWAAARWEADEAAARLCVDYPDAGVYVLNLRQTPKEWIVWLELQLSAARKLGHKSQEGNALGNLGLAYAALGETRRAIEFYEQALVIDREIGDRRGEGNALGNLGNAYADLGETRRAIEFYEQALVIDREIGDRRGEGQALGNLGSAYADLGETRRAIEFYEQALVIDREIGDRRGEGADLGNLGNAYKNLGETRRAIEFYEQQLEIVREIGDRRGEGNALANMSVAYYNKLGDKARGVPLAEAALRIYEALEDPNAAQVRGWLAQWKAQV